MKIFGKKTKETHFVLDAELFEKIYEVVNQQPGEGIVDKRIGYAGRDNRQFIDVVGESFCQDDLRKYYAPEEWRYGFLAPEQDNKFDSNAVAVYLIIPLEESESQMYETYRVGYLKKELAQVVSQNIVNLIVQSGIIIPVLAMVKENNVDENLAVVAYAMTDLIEF